MGIQWLWTDARNALNYNVCTPHGLCLRTKWEAEKKKFIHSTVIRTVNVTITGLPRLNLTFSPSQHWVTFIYPPPIPPSSLKRFVDGLGSNRETWQLLLMPVMSDRLLPRPLHHWQVETKGFILLCNLPTWCKMILCCDWQHPDCKSFQMNAEVWWGEMKCRTTARFSEDTTQDSLLCHGIKWGLSSLRTTTLKPFQEAITRESTI